VLDLVNQYLERGESRWEPNTDATYCQRTRGCIERQLGSVRVRDLDTARVQHWVDHLDGSPRSIAGAVAILSGAFREAVRLRIVEHSPVTGVSLPRIERATHRTWTTGDIARVLAAVATDPMYHALYRLALVSGMRPGELLGLTWDAVDLDRRDQQGDPDPVVRVQRTMTRDRLGRVVPGTDTKTGQHPTIALPESAAAALRAWRTEQKRIRLATTGWEDRGAVFTGRTGKHLAHASWYQRHKAICGAAKVPAITLHELRHTNATVELEAGTHPLIVSNRLGHRKTQTTLDLYSHVSPELHRTATAALEQRIDAALANTTTSAENPAESG
jgi:integrase